MPPTVAERKKGPPTRLEIFGWCCYDFANSAFTTIIITVVFAPWFVARVAEGRTHAEALWGWTLALSQMLVVLAGPVLGAVADQTGRKKQFLLWSAIGCVVPTLLLGLTDTGTVFLALSLVLVANFCFSLGENFTASFLPELSTPENCGRISGYGWAFGYVGGLLSLVIALYMLRGLGLSPKSTFVTTGIFFILAAIPTFLLLNERAERRPWPRLGGLAHATCTETVAFLKALPKRRALFRFFLAFFTFMTGVCSVIAFAGICAEREFGFDQAGIIKLFILLQVAAAAGAFGFGFLQDRMGALPTLLLSLAGWMIVAVASYLITTQGQFQIVAIIAGLVIGSTQSASRALVSVLTEPGHEGETFGYWGLFGKLAAVAGTAGFGTIVALTDLRVAFFLTLVPFVIGAILLLTLRRESLVR
jgi:UMF1 family MFS transporter